MLFTDGNSNMTCAEYYRLHGTLSQERIEHLLENQASDAGDVTLYLYGAKGCYIPEDFMQDEIIRIQCLLKGMRGRTKEELSNILESIQTAIDSQVKEGEYGASEIDNALKELKGLT